MPRYLVKRKSVLAATCVFLSATAAVRAEPLKAPQPANRDFYGDPLPKHALARLGSVRFRPITQVWAMDISPDGKLIATGTFPFAETIQQVELWDSATGKKTGSLVARSDVFNIMSMAFSPDGKKLAVAHNQGVEIFDVKTRMSLKKLDIQKTSKESFSSLRWSPDGKLIAAAPPVKQPEAWLWDAATGKRLQIFELPAASQKLPTDIEWLESWTPSANHRKTLPYSVAFSPDSKRLAIPGYSLLRVFDTTTMKVLRSLDLPGKSVRSVTYSPDGKFLAVSVVSDGKAPKLRVVLWNTTGGGKRELTSNVKWGGKIAFTANSKTVLLSGSYGPVIAWDVATGKKRYSIDQPGLLGRTLSLSADGRALGTGDRRIGLWNTATGKSLYKHNSHGSIVTTARFSPDGKTVYTGGSDGTLRVWESATGRPLKVIEIDNRRASVYAIANNGKFVAAGGFGDAGVIHVFDAKTLEPRGAMRPKKLNVPPKDRRFWLWVNAVKSLVFRPNGDLLSFNGVGFLDVWDVAKLRHKRRLTLRKPLVTPFLSIVVSRDGKQACFPIDGGDLELWDLKKQRRLGSFPAGGDFFSTPSAISTDGKRLVTGVLNQDAKQQNPGPMTSLLRLWNCDTGKAVWTSTEPIGSPRAFAYSSDGKLIASSGGLNDYRVHIWSVADGKRLLELDGHVDMVRNLSFSPDGKRLVSAGQDTTPLVWDMTPALRKLKAAR